ncbi:uncharacterized protein LOC131285574 [Anopheles ziemanni]|uniref:uncharacterized protein LOC131267277 n=1 Tax=Anopheles coustani TaxID=139045 RepID=UPI00265AB02B|nr:uncharacterized protein LOC131267277 [Anopheles coustani]XP_058170416.1 uncharacterized protein LOC131285574 [Anopheles ziemanni]
MKLSIVLGVALVATLASVSAKPSSSSVGDCTKEDEGVTYGVPSDCHQYIVCKKGKLQVKQCESKYNYDTVAAKCVKAKDATCAVEAVPEDPEPVHPEPEESQETNEQYDYLCVKVLYGVRVHPNACDKYLVCTKEKATIEQCADGFIFVADAIECVKGNKVSCTVERDEPSTTEAPTEAPTTEPKEKESEESNESKPGSGESDSGEKSKEGDSGEGDSGEDSKESEGKYDYLCAKKLLGSVAHPESCTKYISCKKYKAKEESCKKGYSYYSLLGLCVKQNNGQCADAPQDPPATEAPTEPPTPVTEPPKSESGESDSGEDSKESEGKYDYLCAKKLLGSVAHPESCTKYISCKKYKAKEESCKKGYSYSSKFGLCLKQNNGQCTDAPQEPSATEAPTEPPKPVTKPPKPESGESDSGEDSKESEGKYDYLCAKKLLGSVAHPESCTKYISCKKYKAKEESCKKGYSYSTKFGLCVKQTNGQCADGPQEPPATEAPTEAPTKPDSGESGESSGETGNETPGKYDYLCENVFIGKCAHPESCTKYISCKKSKAKEENCKKGRYYSVYLQTCIKGNSETCAQGNGNGAPTTVTEPPTTEAPTTEAPTTVYEVPTTEESIPELTPPGTGGDPMEPTVECVEGFTGYVPIESDCTKYVYCFQGEPGERTCMDDYIYYHPFKACLPGDPVLCQLYNV